MDYLLLLMLVVQAAALIPTKARLDNQGLLDLLSWQEVVQEVNKTSSLAQVLQEYLKDMELVEAAASGCTTRHRDRYAKAQATLRKDLEFCLESLKKVREKDALENCLEERSRSVVSDIRNHITSLKACLDSS